MLVFLGYAGFKAWMKYALNDWYGRFYDAVQESPTVEGFDGASGLETDWYDGKREEVSRLLWEFVAIVTPSVMITPIARWISSRWQFAWRMCLVDQYLSQWEGSREVIEGTSQRIHEDTQRFEAGFYACVSVGLDATLSLAVFTPALLQVGGDVHIPFLPPWNGWLFMIAAGAAGAGLLISIFVGRHLVTLEVANQRVEALFRLKLGLIETDKVMIGEGVRDFFAESIDALWDNYKRLFANFAAFNLWVTGYDQFMLLLPYFIVAPLLFSSDPSQRVTLGVLIRTTNAFGEVFGALSTLTQNWTAVNDFRSTVRRLREFERHLMHKGDSIQLVHADVVASQPPCDELNTAAVSVA